MTSDKQQTSFEELRALKRHLAWRQGSEIPAFRVPHTLSRRLTRRQVLEIMTNACCGD